MDSLWQQEAEALFIRMIDSCYAVKYFINSAPCGFYWRRSAFHTHLFLSVTVRIAQHTASGCGLMRIICAFTLMDGNCSSPRISAHECHTNIFFCDFTYENNFTRVWLLTQWRMWCHEGVSCTKWLRLDCIWVSVPHAVRAHTHTPVLYLLGWVLLLFTAVVIIL